MAVRPIDANALQELCNRRIQDTWNSGTTPVSWAEAYADFKDDIDSIPTLTPPNEPRMINADKLAKRIAGHSNYHGDSILAAIYCAAEGKENDVPIRPIETLSNEPLTLDQLREMDGEPVYLKVFDQILKSGWQIIKKTTRERVFFRGWEPPYVRVDGIGVYYNLYRRPPEGDISNGIS